MSRVTFTHAQLKCLSALLDKELPGVIGESVMDVIARHLQTKKHFAKDVKSVDFILEDDDDSCTDCDSDCSDNDPYSDDEQVDPIMVHRTQPVKSTLSHKPHEKHKSHDKHTNNDKQSQPQICRGKKANGHPCTFKTSHGHYCKHHNHD